MDVGDRDPVTGQLTTGHEWNGITELYTPVPRIVFFFLFVTILFSASIRRRWLKASSPRPARSSPPG